jgi:BASS family bile acid:Na+ symporter
MTTSPDARYAHRMSAARLIPLALNVSLFLTVFAVGLRTQAGDATYLWRERSLLLRSILAMNVIVPAVALWVAVVLPVHDAVKIAIVALALSPVPPFLPGKVGKTGGDSGYAVSLMVTTALLTLVTLPASFLLLSNLVGRELHVPLATIMRILGTGIILPLAAGMALRALSEPVAASVARVVGIIAPLLLLGAFGALIAASWPAMRGLIGNGTVVVFIALTMISLSVGYALGGPKHDDRIVLMFAATARHPAVAMALAASARPDLMAASAAVLFSLIIGTVASIPLTRRLKAAARIGPPSDSESPIRVSATVPHTR